MKMTESKEAPEADDQDSDNDAVMDQVCKELMQAFESKDKDKLLDAFHVLVGDIISRLSSDGQE